MVNGLPIPRFARTTLRRHSGPHDDACPTCGKPMVVTTGELPVVVNGEQVLVAGVEHLQCASCGEVVLGYESARALQEHGVEVYRQRHDLLTAEEIRSFRQQLGLTQAQLAALLQLGLNTVSRWESGRNVQSGALDILLKLLRDVPGTLDYLQKRAA
jgi:putative zinc finger/helix-turn-helix YgiT family protein